MVQKRIFVGGLYQGVREEDLQQRFSSYGRISGIEIKVKKDAEGSPVKTFAYLDIDASESDLQKCFRAYNKTRWKGSELSLQFAKDSFIKRLENERQGDPESTEDQQQSRQKTTGDGQVEGSPRKDFNIKCAKPGTLVPGEKDWVVGKYGRALPIVHVKSNDKKKLLRVDPSKYTHNVKKLKDDATQDSDQITTDMLTWQLDNSETELTKKRKGEFSSWSPNKRKNERKNEPDDRFPTPDDDMEVVPLSHNVSNVQNLGSGKPKKSGNKGAFDRLGVASPSSAKANKRTKMSETSKPVAKVGNSDDGYDTGDTDEIIAMTKKNKRISDSAKNLKDNAAKQSGARLQINPLQERLVALAQTVNAHGSNKLVTSEGGYKERQNKKKEKDSKKRSDGTVPSSDADEVPLMEFRGTKFLDDFDSGDIKSTVDAKKTHDVIMSDSDDSDFESLIKKTMSSRQHFSEKHSKAVNNKTHQNSNDNNNNNDIDSVGSADTGKVVSSRSADKVWPSKTGDKIKQKLVSSSKILDEFSSGLVSENDTETSFSKVETDQSGHHETSDEESDFETLVKRELSKQKNRQKHQVKESKRKQNQAQEISEVKKELRDAGTKLPTNNYEENSKSLVKDSFTGSLGSPIRTIKHMDSNKKGRVSSAILGTTANEKPLSKAVVDVDKKRQETVRQRQKEYQAQKNVIQKALAGLDSGPKTNKKIVFADSDDSTDNEEMATAEVGDKFGGDGNEKERMPLKKTSGTGLFDESSEESGDDDDDQDRFKLRPEFEGSAGKKLLKLQSRYGNDERFKLDAKFAESDSEQEESIVEQEEDEKSRQLKILASVLGTSAGIVTDKQDKAKKTFKDVSRLHFDPTKADSTQFEIKTVAKEKPDKVEKKKKKKKKDPTEVEEETPAQPELPEVSKERFTEVSESLRQAFAKKEDSEPQGFSLLEAFGRKDQDSEDETDEEIAEKPFTSVLDPLTLESRFKVTESDSEHEVDKEEAPDENDESSEQPKSIFEDTAPVQPSTFFFTEDDPRLKEGAMFHRTEDMETVRERWLKQRPALLESYRMKHKKFKRKLKQTKQESKKFHNRKHKPR